MPGALLTGPGTHAPVDTVFTSNPISGLTTSPIPNDFPDQATGEQEVRNEV